MYIINTRDGYQDRFLTGTETQHIARLDHKTLILESTNLSSVGRSRREERGKGVFGGGWQSTVTARNISPPPGRFF